MISTGYSLGLSVAITRSCPVKALFFSTLLTLFNEIRAPLCTLGGISVSVLCGALIGALGAYIGFLRYPPPYHIRPAFRPCIFYRRSRLYLPHTAVGICIRGIGFLLIFQSKSSHPSRGSTRRVVPPSPPPPGSRSLFFWLDSLPSSPGRPPGLSSCAACGGSVPSR